MSKPFFLTLQFLIFEKKRRKKKINKIFKFKFLEMLTFGAWYVQGGAISLIGVYIFLVFGATKKNFELWKSVCCSRHDYDHF